MKITTIGIDLAKNVFQLHGVNAQGKTVLKKQLHRDAMLSIFLPAVLVWRPVEVRITGLVSCVVLVTM